MKRIYLLDTHESCMTGFSTYKKELLNCLGEYSHISLYQIIENYPTGEFMIQEKDGIVRFYFPKINSYRYKYFIIGSILKQYIPNACDVIFMLNYSPAYRVLAMLKDFFPASKIIYIIHDFIWANFVLGDVNVFKDIIQKEMQHNYSDIIYKAYEDNLQAFSLSDKIVCLSKDTYDLLLSFYKLPLSKISLIYNGLRDEAETGISHIRNEGTRKIILSVGRVNKQKGMLDLLCCFQKVVNRFPDCQLVIAGHIQQKTMNLLNEQTRKNIHFLGQIGCEELYQWYRTADIGIIPSYYEQCSYVGIEMKMFGLPIIASDGFGVRSMFNQNNALIAYIDRENGRFQQNLSDCIIKMLTFPKKVLSLYAKKSRDSYLACYHIIGMQRKYLNLIENI